MNEDTLRTIEQWRSEGHRVAVSQVVRTYRSAPRPVGSIFAVSDHGKMAGSVSGGCVEGAIYGEAQDLFATAGAPPRYLHYGISDELAGDVGLACGGELWVSLIEAAERPQLRRGAIVTAITGPQAGRRLVFDADTDGADGDLEGAVRNAALDAARDAVEHEESGSTDLGDEGLLFVEAVHPAHRLVIVGAVDTAEEICKLARQLGWRTVVIDPRTKFATAERMPHADEIIGSWPQDAYDQVALERADSVIVLTHDAKIDDPALEWAIRGGASYVGALGSRRTQGLRQERLVEAGLAREDVERIYGPVGLDIGAHTPAETAVSIVSEVIAHRSGRTGRALVATSGRIHPTTEPE
jgi:xanthine dehydrogenase accessory factor